MPPLLHQIKIAALSASFHLPQALDRKFPLFREKLEMQLLSRRLSTAVISALCLWPEVGTGSSAHARACLVRFIRVTNTCGFLSVFSCLLTLPDSYTVEEMTLRWKRLIPVQANQDLELPQFDLKAIDTTKCARSYITGEWVSRPSDHTGLDYAPFCSMWHTSLSGSQ